MDCSQTRSCYYYYEWATIRRKGLPMGIVMIEGGTRNMCINIGYHHLDVAVWPLSFGRGWGWAVIQPVSYDATMVLQA